MGERKKKAREEEKIKNNKNKGKKWFDDLF